MNAQDIICLLDYSPDAETIALEIVSHETLNLAIDDLLHQHGWATYEDLIGATIRELWDIAYSYGYYDGQTETNEGII